MTLGLLKNSRNSTPLDNNQIAKKKSFAEEGSTTTTSPHTPASGKKSILKKKSSFDVSKKIDGCSDYDASFDMLVTQRVFFAVTSSVLHYDMKDDMKDDVRKETCLLKPEHDYPMETQRRNSTQEIRPRWKCRRKKNINCNSAQLLEYRRASMNSKYSDNDETLTRSAEGFGKQISSSTFDSLGSRMTSISECSTRSSQRGRQLKKNINFGKKISSSTYDSLGSRMTSISECSTKSSQRGRQLQKNINCNSARLSEYRKASMNSKYSDNDRTLTRSAEGFGKQISSSSFDSLGSRMTSISECSTKSSQLPIASDFMCPASMEFIKLFGCCTGSSPQYNPIVMSSRRQGVHSSKLTEEREPMGTSRITAAYTTKRAKKGMSLEEDLLSFYGKKEPPLKAQA